MKSLKIFSFALLLILSASVKAQTDKVKAGMSDIPDEMNLGETYKIAVTITNIGTNDWSSENLSRKFYGPFDVTKEWEGVWKLKPGESTQVYYKVTPLEAGQHKLRVMIYNGDKRIGYRSKKVTVNSTSVK